MAQQQYDGLRGCFDHALLANPNLFGNATFHFSINPDGSIANATSSDVTLPAVDVAPCAVQKLHTLRFPARANRAVVNVTLPIRFDAPSP